MGSESTYLLLLVLGVLVTKHLVFDFFTQTLAQIRNKRIYAHPSGLIHAGGHAAGTCLAFLVLTPSLVVGTAIVIGEFFVHYHIDWLKEIIGSRMKLRPEHKSFWVAFGIDQWLHHLTYIGIALILALS
jgi:hypothetical protein